MDHSRSYFKVNVCIQLQLSGFSSDGSQTAPLIMFIKLGGVEYKACTRKTFKCRGQQNENIN